MKIRIIKAFFVIGLTVLTATACTEKPALVAADTIYFNGNVITLDSNELMAEAVAVKDGKILAVGDNETMMSLSNQDTHQVDLKGKTMLPGFVDGHSHLSGVAIQAVTANLLPPPDGPGQNIAMLQRTLRDFMATSEMVKQHSVVIGFNYDDSQLEEGRHPNRHELDAVSTEMPIMITHQSGHIGVYNSKALEMFGINAESDDPSGGIIQREAGSKEPNGVLEENAHFALLYKIIPPFTVKENVAAMKAAEMQYLSNGFTTIQDGKTDPTTLGLMAQYAADGGFYSRRGGLCRCCWDDRSYYS